MAPSILEPLQRWFRPVLVAFFKHNIPWNLRWRLLLLQPTALITYSISSVQYLFSRPFSVEWLPVFPGRCVRTLVYKAPGTGRGRALRPLHIGIHGGAFIGGLAEDSARFEDKLARETGAVVVSITYRFAPEHTFPTAIDDVDATIHWIQEHAEQRWGADPSLTTVSGSSAGGNLALAAMQQPNCHGSSTPTAFKASLTFFAAIEMRLSPWQKPKPASMPAKDPLAVLMPLFDAYPSPARAKHMDDPRLSPILSQRQVLPERMMMVIAGVDILVAEQMEFAERINGEDEREGREPRVRVQVEEKGFHGYLELPDMIYNEELKQSKRRAFTNGVTFLKETYKVHGWSWEE